MLNVHWTLKIVEFCQETKVAPNTFYRDKYIMIWRCWYKTNDEQVKNTDTLQTTVQVK